MQTSKTYALKVSHISGITFSPGDIVVHLNFQLIFQIPLEEVYDPSSIDRSAPRGRATTIGNGHALRLNTGLVLD